MPGAADAPDYRADFSRELQPHHLRMPWISPSGCPMSFSNSTWLRLTSSHSCPQCCTPLGPLMQGSPIPTPETWESSSTHSHPTSHQGHEMLIHWFLPISPTVTWLTTHATGPPCCPLACLSHSGPQSALSEAQIGHPWLKPCLLDKDQTS